MNSEIFTSTFTEMRFRLLGLASRFLKNDEDANDALQDAFCRLWQRHEEIESRSEVEALSITTVKNLCIDNLRKNSKVNSISIDESDTAINNIQDKTIESDNELYISVKQIIERKLTETQKTIIRMRDIDDESYQTIAEVLDMQEATVRVQLSRARKSIREYYKSNKI